MNTKNLLGAVIALGITVATIAAPVPYNTYSAGTTNAGTASDVIIGALSANGGIPVVTAIDAISDKNGSRVTAYRVTHETAATHTNSTTTLFVQGTNGFGVSGTIIIRHLLTDTYEKRALGNNSSATNLVVTAASLEAVVPGDIIYKVASSGAGSLSMKTNTFTVANSGLSLTLTGERIIAGQKGKPLLLEVDADTTGAIRLVTAKFE
jgi:imidazole glycerol phosphate synthase subunit HisF